MTKFVFFLLSVASLFFGLTISTYAMTPGHYQLATGLENPWHFSLSSDGHVTLDDQIIARFPLYNSNVNEHRPYDDIYINQCKDIITSPDYGTAECEDIQGKKVELTFALDEAKLQMMTILHFVKEDWGTWQIAPLKYLEA